MPAAPEPGNARDEKADTGRRDHPLPPFWLSLGQAFPGSSTTPSSRARRILDRQGWIVLAAVALGVVLLGISWYFTQSPTDRDG
jgi:hypothetical protein